jgi:tRNA modification GTPase
MAPLEWDGLRFVLQDTAGLGDSQDALDIASYRAANTSADRASLLVWIHATDKAWSPEEVAALRRLETHRVIIVLSKRDLCDATEPPPESQFARVVEISAERGDGMKELRDALIERLRDIATAESASWQFDATSAAADRIAAAAGEAKRDAQRGSTLSRPEVIAFELRDALTQLSTTGQREQTESLLGRIYSSFCIGK